MVREDAFVARRVVTMNGRWRARARGCVKNRSVESQSGRESGQAHGAQETCGRQHIGEDRMTERRISEQGKVGADMRCDSGQRSQEAAR